MLTCTRRGFRTTARLLRVRGTAYSWEVVILGVAVYLAAGRPEPGGMRLSQPQASF